MNIPSLSPPVLRNDRAAQLSIGGVMPSFEACIGGSYENGNVCGDLPIIGKKCFHIGGPSITAAARICVTGSVFPPSLRACVYVNDTKLGCVGL